STGGYTGGGSTGGYTGGGSTGGYTGDGSTGGYTGGGSTGGYTGGGSTGGYTGGGSTGGYTGDGSTGGSTGGGSTASQDTIPEGIYLSSNSSFNDYRTWSYPVFSYLYKEDGYFWRVEVGTNGYRYENDGNVYVEKYDGSLKLAGHSVISFGSSLYWGGFYHGLKYNFIIVGDRNKEEDDNKTVIRIIKYDKQWNQLGSVDLKGANTTVPFDAGSLRCAEANGYLFVTTSHERYTTSDGKNHQSNMSFSIDEESMTMPYAGYLFQPGYVSHSFNQYILVNENGQIVTADHGDAYPRAMQVAVLEVENGVIRSDNERSLISFKGNTGDNGTGATLGGIEETSDGYVAAFNDNRRGSADTVAAKSIYAAFIAKGVTDDPTERSGVRIVYDADGTIRTTTPVMVSTGINNGGYIFWEEYSKDKSSSLDAGKKVCYVKYDTLGSISDIYSFSGSLSDCKPIYDNGTICWYVTGKVGTSQWGYDTNEDTAPCFYFLNTGNGQVSRQYPGGSVQLLESVPTVKAKEYYINTGDGGDILFKKDISDASGKLQTTEYYDEENQLVSKAVYSYNETGTLTGKAYYVIGDGNTVPETEYGYYPESGKIKTISSGKTVSYEDGSTVYDYYNEYYENGGDRISKTTVDYYDENGAVTSRRIEETDWYENGIIAARSASSSNDSGESFNLNAYYENGAKKQTTRKYTYTGSPSSFSLTEEYFNEEENLIKSVSNTNQSVTTKLYDDNGRILETDYSDNTETNESGYVIKYTYNEDGSYSSRKDYTTGYWEIKEYNAQEVQTRNYYLNANGTYDYNYDGSSRIVQEKYIDNSENNAGGYVKTYTYNEDGTYVKETLYTTSKKTVITYNAEGREIRREEYFASGRLNYIYEYGLSGNLNTIVYSEFRRDDEQNSLSSKTESVIGESGTLTEKKETEYDTNGNNTVRRTVVTLYNAEGLRYSKTETQYYVNGRILSITVTDIVYSESNSSGSERLKRNTEYYDNESNSCESVRENVEVNGRNQETTIHYSEDGYKLVEKVTVDDEYSYGYYNYYDPKNGYYIYYSENEKPYNRSEYDENRNEIRRTTYVDGIDYEIFELQNGVWVKAANGSYTDPTSEEIYDRITALKNGEYSEGTAWTNENTYAWNSTVTSPLGVTRLTGYGCQAFAMIASDAAFGNAPVYRYDNDGTATVRVGDILRLNNDTHSVIVLAISGDTLTIAEGNFNGMIHWERTISLSNCGFTYGYTRYRPD
ncbi:MAG: hypothetical protein J5824_03775, partial [Lachnospiraceae bacterium]|nr:hypothetical protein [Lachnospiraceae bacterium]